MKEVDKTKQSRIIRLLGTLLILGGAGLLVHAGIEKGLVAYYQYQLRKAYQDSFFELPESSIAFRRVVITERQPMRLQMPKINVDLMVLNGDVFDMDLLNRGPVHFQMSDLPSTNPGNVAIAAHRGSRWGFFTDLDLLEEGDEIYLDVGGYRFIYRVLWVRIVEPTDWSVIFDPTDYPALTLQTCYPKNVSATHRLIARASLDTVVPAPNR